MSASDAPEARYGEVYDRGYGHYEGMRRGRAHGIWALARWSMARALGLKKGWGSKVIPALLYIGALLPVIVVIGETAFVPQADVLDYAGYFATIFLLEGIFVATIAPEMMCPDRREGVLSLYFSRPLSRPDYVVVKLLAAAILTLSISLLPAVILWLGLQLLADAPLAAMRDNVGDLGRILVAGSSIALYLGAIGLVISSFTRRKGVAVGVIVLGFLISESLTQALSFALRGQEPWNEWVQFLSPTLTASGLVIGLWEVADDDVFGVATPLWTIVAVMVGVVAVCCAVMFGRYAGRD
ncbi:MAG TPA: ABC transporter permease subunit [Thermomicrobiales bacterium]|nr:ABC transporter permease subunit [Thermomicrobiales bacterium]